MNPKDILGVDPSGATKSAYDERDHLYTETGYGSAPFDWNLGYDIEQEIGAKLGTPEFALKIKNQGSSGSCGGQAEGYMGGMISPFFDNVEDEKSAKFTYAPVAVPGGGSAGRALADRAVNAGWGSESLTPSYQNGQPPKEAFMEQVADITPEATAAAKKDRALSYALVNLDIDSIAQAIRDNRGVRIGVVGSNNGTWLSEFPQPPVDGELHWYHWTTCGKAKLINGQKFVGFPNSWGDTVGDKGWQWYGANYFTQALTNDPNGNTRAFFEARTYVFNPVPVPASFHHVFNTDLQFGMASAEVQNLQTALQVAGFFPANVPTTQYFGTVTQGAVQKFQIAHGIVAAGGAGYGRCGPLTRAELNKEFGQ